MSKPAEAARTVTIDKSAGMSTGGAVGKGPAVSIGIGGGKGTTKIGGGGEKPVGVAIGAEVGKSGAGLSFGIGFGDSAGAGGSTGRGDTATGASEKKTGVGAGASVGGVSLPESVVAPLIGAGANVYILTNELTQSMRQKIGSSWPLVQDQLNSRYAKLLAGGFLASVTLVIAWKIYRRLSSKGKKPADSDDDDAGQWGMAKPQDLTTPPVVMLEPKQQRRQQAPKSEGDGAFTLPGNLQLCTDTTPQGAKARDPDVCKARDPATRHRHTHHLDPCRAGEQATAAAALGFSPWHMEHQRSRDLSSNCACPRSEQCVCGALSPRLLYSVRDNRKLYRALHPHLEDLLTHASCPSPLCSPVLLGSAGACAHAARPKSCCLSSHPYRAPSLVSHHPLIQSPLTEVMTTAVGHLSYPGMQPVAQHGRLHGLSCLSTSHGESMKTGIPSSADGMSGYSIQESHPMSSEYGFVEGKVRSMNQQTNGQPMEVDSVTLGHGTGVPRSDSFQTSRQYQSVPTRTVQSPCTASQCTSTSIRADNRTYATCPANSSTQSCMATVTPQVFQLSTAGGECPGSYPGVMEGFGSRALSLPPLFYHPHLSSVQPPLIQQQQQHLLRVQPQHGQQQQQQQPVVQHPSDSSCSQNSTEACPSQESRQYGGSQSTTVSQETAAAEALSQERALLLQQPYGKTVATTVSPRHHHASSLCALDYAQPDFTWHRPLAFHRHQPSPVCLMGCQPHNCPHHMPQHNLWSTPQAMFLTPSGGLVMSSPAGMLAASAPALLPCSQQMAFRCQPPYLYPQEPLMLPSHTTFSPNFNLSNCNAHVFGQEAGQNGMQGLPLPQDASKLRVIGSDHSMTSSSQPTNTTAGGKAEPATFSSSEISLQMVEADAVAEVTTNNPQPVPGSTPKGKDMKKAQACVTSQTDPASHGKELDEKDAAVPSLDAVAPEDTALKQEAGAAAEAGGELQADACTVQHAEEAAASAASCGPPPCCTIAASALSDGGETQL